MLTMNELEKLSNHDGKVSLETSTGKYKGICITSNEGDKTNYLFMTNFSRMINSDEVIKAKIIGWKKWTIIKRQSKDWLILILKTRIFLINYYGG